LARARGAPFYDIIEAQATFGWTTFDQSLKRQYEAGQITEETAQLYATAKPRMTRFIDDVKKQQGLVDDRPTGLRLDMDAALSAPKAVPAPAIECHDTFH
jgi:twitching motility protein PilT